jgi:hypothetical protein
MCLVLIMSKRRRGVHGGRGRNRDNRKKQNLTRQCTFTIEEVLTIIRTVNIPKQRMNFHGIDINMASQRLKLFAEKGTVCCACNLEGTFFAAECHDKQDKFHLNLYGIDDDGDEVLFTKDHVICKGKDGSNTQNNYQVMCRLCNNKKSEFETQEILVLSRLEEVIKQWIKFKNYKNMDEASNLSKKIEVAITLKALLQGE